ncbi:MAG TPA: ECF transporter S component [Kouleothrix sp.]|uniref:ECF transporter S component n=1 Tax=Kouleothrix sp. TaxID=2779161 RepID=UPI002CAB9376|nr:ECF transporter S component [Kouleothrix sp.]HRC76473.1 ECF transporter S component [Kouleothrix sp.]
MSISEPAASGRNSTAQNRWVRPLLPLLIIAIAAIVLLYLGGFVATAQGATDDAALPLSRWLGVIAATAVILYGLYVGLAAKPIWQFGTREVVYAAIGAALYGVLSWATNIIQLPSISLVALRPAVVIPVFFGIAFGPLVGFFSGFVGNVLGDALTGWGVYPLWDVGNGLMGLVPGLIVAFSTRRRALDVVTIVVAALSLLATLLLVTNASFTVTDFNGNENPVGPLWWLPLLGGVLAVGARYLFAKREELAAAEVWGALGIIIGIGFAAFGGVFQNGTSPALAFFGEFVPAAGSNLINVLILLPILLTAWTAARARSGR